MATTKNDTVKDIVKDPWKEMVTVKLPKAVNGDLNYMIASVNGRVFKIQRGINVEVPAPIAEVLEHSFQAEDEAEMFIEKNGN